MISVNGDHCHVLPFYWPYTAGLIVIAASPVFTYGISVFLQEDGDIEAVGASEEDIVDELPANDVDSKQADVLMSGDNLRQA